MKTSLVSLALAFSLAACQTASMSSEFVEEAAAAHAKNEQLVIWNNYGGEFGQVASVRNMIREGLKVHIVGVCASACTILLAEKENVTYSKDAVFVFHGSAAPSSSVEAQNKRIISIFAPKLQEYLIETKAVTDPNRVVKIPAYELAEMDWEYRIKD